MSASGTSLSQTWRLAISYLCVIMVMSVLFSSIIYFLLSAQLDRPLPPHKRDAAQTASEQAALQARFDERDAQVRTGVLISLTALNLVVFAGGSGMSYYLARRTLRPIEQAMDAQSQFVSDASHELRTPLTALLTMNEVALRKKQLGDAKAREVLEKNIVEIEKLHSLSEALLGLAKADRMTGSSVSVRMDALVDSVVESLLHAAQAKKISVHADSTKTEVELHADVVRQVLSVLLDNAIKYSPVGSHITIAATPQQISVTDEGIGIPSLEQTKIFERFYRADSARTRTEASGYGLGLAIARTAANRHGYEIVVASEPGQGSTFTLDLHA